MKNVIIPALSIALISFAFPANATGATDPTPKTIERETVASKMQGRIILVRVDGMVCDFCAQSLKKVLEKKEAVEKVEISLETKIMTITLIEGGTLSDAEIDKAVNWAGYTLAGIERPSPAN